VYQLACHPTDFNGISILRLFCKSLDELKFKKTNRTKISGILHGEVSIYFVVVVVVVVAGYINSPLIISVQLLVFLYC